MLSIWTSLIKRYRLLKAILRKKALENNVGKGENTGDLHFLFFNTMFSPLSKKEINLLAT